MIGFVNPSAFLHRDLKSLLSKISFISAAWEAAFYESCFPLRTVMSVGPEYVTAFGSPKSFSFIFKPAYTYGMSLCFWALAQLCCGSVISYAEFVEIEACLFAIVIPRGIPALSSYLIFSSHLISSYGTIQNIMVIKSWFYIFKTIISNHFKMF